jgi:hypothetical protein
MNLTDQIRESIGVSCIWSVSLAEFIVKGKAVEKIIDHGLWKPGPRR